jgi:hypothetical protein
VGGIQVENEREDRLRRQIEELVRSRLVILEQDISRLQREVNESFTRLLERTDVAAAMPESDQQLAQIAAEVTAQVDSAGAESARLSADIALLRDSVAELDEQKTQAEVLNALVARAGNFAPRVVLFVVKGQNALAWAARGFDDGVGNSAIRGLSIPLESDTALRAALNSQQTYYGPPEEQSDNQLIISRLGGVQPVRVLAVALKVRNKPAAVVYADSATSGETATNVEAIELLVRSAGVVVELVSLRTRMAEAAGQQAAQPKQPSAPIVPPTAPPSPVQPSSGQLSETVRPSGTLTGTGFSGPLPAPSGPLPQPNQDGAPSGELRPPAAPTQTYFRPAAEGTTQDVQTTVMQPPADTTSPPITRTAPLDEEEKLHNDARRFARLLVSEIKLYNEQKVADGRRNSDLYDRLKEDIDRSRQMYEKRVAPTVAAKFDYFYDELVNTLAEGNPATLGSDHPGPSVQA